MYQLAGNACVDRFTQKILMALPNAKNPGITPEKAVPRLDATRNEPSFKLAPPAAQTLRNHVQNLLGAMLEERPLDMDRLHVDQRFGGQIVKSHDHANVECYDV